MKKIIVVALLLIISVASFSQQSKSSAALTKQDYLQKSKKQKKAAWIMLGGGATLLLTGTIIPKGEPTVYNSTTNVFNLFSVDGPPETIYKNDRIKRIIGFTGVLSMLCSIHYFIASDKNNKRAMSLSFKNETAPQLQKSSFVYHPVPSLSLKISL